MKGALIIAAALVQLAAAQPHHNHQHLHEKRDVVTKIDIVTATTPDVVVFVDQFGNPVSTSYVNPWYKTHKNHKPTHHSSSSHAVKTSAPAAAPAQATVAPAAAAPAVAAPAVAASAESAAAAPVEPAAAAPVETTTPVYVAPVPTTLIAVAAPAAQTTQAATSAAPVVSASKGSSGGYGLTYSPYNADGTCKSQAQVNSDFAQLGDYSLVRMYGVDCNQLSTVGSAAVAKGMKLFLGVYSLGSVASDIATIIAYVGGNWANVHTVSIGNELVNSNQASVSDVVSAVNTARALLQAAGYSGPVVTVDTFNAVLNNPELCQVSDYAAINAHAFFDPNTNAGQAGTWVSGIFGQVKAACNKDVMVTESGWPSQGSNNGAAVPSPANQATAISSIKSALDPSSLILFTAYNDLWKSDFQGSFGCEKYWGIYGTSSQ